MHFQKGCNLLVCAAFAAALPGLLGAPPPHLTQGEALVTSLSSDAKNINEYGTDYAAAQNGTSAHIDWTGDPRTAISECSTFLTLLLEHTYGYTQSAFYAKTGHYSPTAANYYDAITAHKSFTPVAGPAVLLPGDTIAVKYPAGQEATGHMMTVVSVGPWQPRANSTQTFLAGGYSNIYGYYDVTVMDSSASFHGPTDTRANKPGGIGIGVARFYVDASHNFTGYTWSTVNASAYYSAATTGYLTAFGRWIQ
jgi:hypothetical protein